jgi:hypothetical protein
MATLARWQLLKVCHWWFIGSSRTLAGKEIGVDVAAGVGLIAGVGAAAGMDVAVGEEVGVAVSVGGEVTVIERPGVSSAGRRDVAVEGEVVGEDDRAQPAPNEITRTASVRQPRNSAIRTCP